VRYVIGVLALLALWHLLYVVYAFVSRALIVWQRKVDPCPKCHLQHRGRCHEAA